MENTVQTTFKRTRRLGLNIVDLKDKKPHYLKIHDLKEFTKKDGEVLEYVEATDLATGEVVHFWMDGGLRGAVNQSKITLAGAELEIMWKGKVEVTINDEPCMVNSYDLFEIDSSLN